MLALAASGCGGGGQGTTAATTTTARTTTTVVTTTTATTTAPAVTAIAIAVKDGKPVGGITRAEVKKGAAVVLVVHSDIADEIHLHGYDKQVDVEAGGTARLRFTADVAGVFEAELENEGLQILELTVE